MFVAYFVTPDNLQVGMGYSKILKNCRACHDFCHSLYNVEFLCKCVFAKHITGVYRKLNSLEIGPKDSCKTNQENHVKYLWFLQLICHNDLSHCRRCIHSYMVCGGCTSFILFLQSFHIWYIYFFSSKMYSVSEFSWCFVSITPTAVQLKSGTRKLNPSNQRNKKSNLERKENIKEIESVKTQDKNQVKLLEVWENTSDQVVICFRFVPD